MTQLTKLLTPKWLVFIFATLAMQSLYAEEAPSQETGVSKDINSVITARQHPYLKQANFSNRTEDLDALYKSANYQLLWLGKASSTKKVADIIALLKNASTQGLSPDDYDAKILEEKSKYALTTETPKATKELALYDTALSISLLRYLHDIHYGRVSPKGINFNLKLREKKLLDFPTLIKNSSTQDSISQLPLLVEPKLQQYQKLKSALATYRQMVAQVMPLKLVINRKLRPGEHHPQLAELSKFLALVGDIPETAVINGAEQNPRYAPEIVDGIKKFQRRHGLASDGTIGQGTVEALNEPLAKRITQIELAMERLRWLPELDAVNRLIVVNIPAFQLWAIDGSDQANLNITNMRVVVGKALKNQTPVLMAQMSYVEFGPYWNVPKNILKDEILPKLARNPGYLASQNMEIVSSGNSTKSVPFNKEAIENLKKGLLRIRQRPGNKNSLGKVKFIFPNKDDVYLHDTPANSLFSKSRRDFSHGCVRVENPKALAEFALKNQGKWNADTIQKAMKNPANQHVDLQRPIPVLFFYVTTYVDQNNDLDFYSDIYGLDEVLIEALKKSNDLSDQSIFVSTNTSVTSNVPNENSP